MVLVLFFDSFPQALAQSALWPMVPVVAADKGVAGPRQDNQAVDSSTNVDRIAMRVDTKIVSQPEHDTTPVLRSSPKRPAYPHPRAQALGHLAAMPSIAPAARVPEMARRAAVRVAMLQPPEQGPPARETA